MDPVVIASRKHDLNVIQVYDRRDSELPDAGLLKVHDAETGEDLWIDTSVRSVRENYADSWHKQQERLQTTFTRTGTNYVTVRTDEDYVKALMKLFKC